MTKCPSCGNYIDIEKKNVVFCCDACLDNYFWNRFDYHVEAYIDEHIEGILEHYKKEVDEKIQQYIDDNLYEIIRNNTDVARDVLKP